jgi:hypothetical protein
MQRKNNYCFHLRLAHSCFFHSRWSGCLAMHQLPLRFCRSFLNFRRNFRLMSYSTFILVMNPAEQHNAVTLKAPTQTNWDSVEPSLVRFEKLQSRSSFTRSPLLQVSPAVCAQSFYLIATSSILSQNFLAASMFPIYVYMYFINKAPLCNLALVAYFPNDEMRLNTRFNIATVTSG